MTKNSIDWYQSIDPDDAELAKIDFAILIDEAVKEKGWSRTQLAQALEVSPAWITKVLRGDVNLTIDTMAKLCKAVGKRMKISVEKPFEQLRDKPVQHSETVIVDAPTPLIHRVFSQLVETRNIKSTSFEAEFICSGWSSNDTQYLNEVYANAA